MNISVEELTDAALSLPRDARALLADRLAESLNPLDDEEIQNAWATEANRRLAEIDFGTVEPIDSEQVLADVREAIR